MSHDTGQNQSSNPDLMDDPEPGATWFVSIAGTVVFIALVFVLSVMFFKADQSTVTEVQVDAPFEPLVASRQKQQELLSQFVRYDEKTPDGKSVERIRITIDRAMDLMAADLASKPRAAADAPAGTRAGAQPK